MNADILHFDNLLSNQVYDKQTKTGLVEGQGVYAFLLNAKSGRIIADVNVIDRGDREPPNVLECVSL